MLDDGVLLRFSVTTPWVFFPDLEVFNLTMDFVNVPSWVFYFYSVATLVRLSIERRLGVHILCQGRNLVGY